MQCFTSINDPEQASSQGNLLFEQGAYRRAGECYQTGSEYTLANRAFFKAVGPESAVTVRRLSDQQDQVKTRLRKVQQGFGVDP
jgi:hypothetical protein